MPPISRPPKTPRRNSLTMALLSSLATGALRIGAIAAISLKPRSPTARSIRRWFYEIDEAIATIHVDAAELINNAAKQRQLSRAIQAIRKRHFARVVKRDGRLVLEITEEGRKRLIPYTIHLLSLEPQKTWDNRWRIVLFDIPEKNRVGRDVLRGKLRDLGFFQLQKSVFVFPYPCFDVLDILIRHLAIAPYITFFETDSLGYHEASALAHFQLRKKQARKS